MSKYSYNMRINFEERGTKGTRKQLLTSKHKHESFSTCTIIVETTWIIQYIIIIEKVVRKKKMCQLPGGAVKREYIQK